MAALTAFGMPVSAAAPLLTSDGRPAFASGTTAITSDGIPAFGLTAGGFFARDYYDMIGKAA